MTCRYTSRIMTRISGAGAAPKKGSRCGACSIFVTPEYNRSVPGVLKNAIDHASRPYGQSAWKGKPAGIYWSVCGRTWNLYGAATLKKHSGLPGYANVRSTRGFLSTMGYT